MGVRFFGQYLLENGVIKAEQLLAAIAKQDETNLKFGDMAISLELLTKEQVDRILALQRERDIKIGEASVELGFLTTAQVEQVLRAQKNSHIMVGEALVATGGLTREQLEVQLAAFAEDQKPFRVVQVVSPALDPTGVARPVIDLATKFLLRIAGLQVRVGELRGQASLATGRLTSRVAFHGDVKGEVVLRGKPELCARVASGILGEPVAASDVPTVLDGLGEFLNVLCGNLAAQLARSGKSLELAAPQHGEVTLSSDVRLVEAQLGSPEGELDLIVITH